LKILSIFFPEVINIFSDDNNPSSIEKTPEVITLFFSDFVTLHLAALMHKNPKRCKIIYGEILQDAQT